MPNDRERLIQELIRGHKKEELITMVCEASADAPRSWVQNKTKRQLAIDLLSCQGKKFDVYGNER